MSGVRTGRMRLAVAALAVAGVADLLLLNVVAMPALLAASPASPIGSLQAEAPPDPGPAPVLPAAPGPDRAQLAAARDPVPPAPVEPAPVEPATPTEETAESGHPSLGPLPVALPLLRFSTGSAGLGLPARSVLWEAVRLLRERPALEVLLVGHADERGDEATNHALSVDRAEAAAVFLVERGVDRARIRVEGRGASEPADPRSTPAAHSRNRRVEVVWR